MIRVAAIDAWAGYTIYDLAFADHAPSACFGFKVVVAGHPDIVRGIARAVSHVDAVYGNIGS
jgi:hypothetical protein